MKFPFPFKSPESAGADDAEEPAEFSIEGLRPRSDRFFFKPGRSNSILEEAKSRAKREASVLEIDSTDPFLDFRASMEEMATAHALKDWGDLENLLSCYLRVNRKHNHGYIIGAFVDLVFHLAAVDENCSSSSLTTTAETHERSDFTSPLYSFSSYSDKVVEKDGGGSHAVSSG